MPESKGRRRSLYTPPAGKSGANKPNAAWFAPLMVTLMLVGLAWIVIFYLTEQAYPIPGIGTLNLVIGFIVLLGGFFMTTRWR